MTSGLEKTLWEVGMKILIHVLVLRVLWAIISVLCKMSQEKKG